MALGENIRARRTQLKMSQEYVAEQLGISRQAVAKWEAGKSEPTASNLAELAKLFEMSIGELTDPQKYAEEQQTREEKQKDIQKSAKMHVGRAAAYLLMNAGWDGYSSGLYGTDFPYYWLAILGFSIILLFITSKDMNQRHKTEKLQALLGIAAIFSIFFLPGAYPCRFCRAPIFPVRYRHSGLPYCPEPQILAPYLENEINLRDEKSR